MIECIASTEKFDAKLTPAPCNARKQAMHAEQGTDQLLAPKKSCAKQLPACVHLGIQKRSYLLWLLKVAHGELHSVVCEGNKGSHAKEGAGYVICKRNRASLQDTTECMKGSQA